MIFAQRTRALSRTKGADQQQRLALASSPESSSSRFMLLPRRRPNCEGSAQAKPSISSSVFLVTGCSKKLAQGTGRRVFALIDQPFWQIPDKVSCGMPDKQLISFIQNQ